MYVLKCRNKCIRSFIAQIRAGVLPLRVETGRFTNTNIEDRMCRMCGILEDEVHFIFECSLYAQLRMDFYNAISSHVNVTALSNVEKLRIFMQEPIVLNKFGTYLKNCFYKRNLFMYNTSLSWLAGMYLLLFY